MKLRNVLRFENARVPAFHLPTLCSNVELKTLLSIFDIKDTVPDNIIRSRIHSNIPLTSSAAKRRETHHSKRIALTIDYRAKTVRIYAIGVTEIRHKNRQKDSSVNIAFVIF